MKKFIKNNWGTIVFIVFVSVCCGLGFRSCRVNDAKQVVEHPSSIRYESSDNVDRKVEVMIESARDGDFWAWPWHPQYEQRAEEVLAVTLLKEGWRDKADRIVNQSRFDIDLVRLARIEAKAEFKRYPESTSVHKDIVMMQRSLGVPMLEAFTLAELLADNKEALFCETLWFGYQLGLSDQLREYQLERFHFRGCWREVLRNARQNGENWKVGVEVLYSLIEAKSPLMYPAVLDPSNGWDQNALTFADRLQPTPSELVTVKLLHALVMYDEQKDEEVKGLLLAENFYDDFKSILLLPTTQRAEGILLKRGIILPQ